MALPLKDFPQQHVSVSKNASWPPTWIGILLIALPCFAYVWVSCITSLNVPHQDDFDALMGFTATYAGLHGFGSRLWWVLTSQHNDYKLIFEHGLIALQFEALHHVNYQFLQLVGDCGMPATMLCLWSMLARSKRALAERVWLFVPICYLMLGLEYWETVNWAMADLQNLTIVPFALFAILWIDRPSLWKYLLACASLVASIACSGNGFFAVFAVALLLLLEKHWKRLAGVIVLTGAVTALYLVHYEVIRIPRSISLVKQVGLILISPFAFLGSIAVETILAFALGLALIYAFVALARRGWHRIDPASFATAVFVLFTALAIGLMRSKFGHAAATVSRYRIYSPLMLCALYLGWLHVFAPLHLLTTKKWRQAWVGFAVFSVLLCAVTDLYGYRSLMQRKNLLLAHLIFWESHSGSIALTPDEDPMMYEPSWVLIRVHYADFMRRALRTHAYLPPVTPASVPPVVLHSRAVDDAEKGTP